MKGFYFIIKQKKIMNITKYQKIDLPKITVRFKSTADQTQQPKPIQPQVVKQFSSNPTVFMDRLKMAKQIQESFLKFRRLKKNNYQKVTHSVKRQIQSSVVKRNQTVVLNMKPISIKNHFVLSFYQHQSSETLKYSREKPSKYQDGLESQISQNREEKSLQNIMVQKDSLLKWRLRQKTAKKLKEFHQNFYKNKKRQEISQKKPLSQNKDEVVRNHSKKQNKRSIIIDQNKSNEHSDKFNMILSIDGWKNNEGTPSRNSFSIQNV